MSDSAKRIDPSGLRREKNATRADRQERRGVPPMWCVHAERLRASTHRRTILASVVDKILRRTGRTRRFRTLLQFKGFGGGVPLNPSTDSGLVLSKRASVSRRTNTETAAVKPRVGSAS